MFTCLPSMAPMQLGKSHLLLKPLSMLTQVYDAVLVVAKVQSGQDYVGPSTQ